MTAYFADTYYFIALLNEDDEGHERALLLNRQLVAPMVTTVWVLTEVANAMSDPPYRQIFLELLDELENDSEVLIVPPDTVLFQRGIDLFRRRPDKEWSLTDCISFVVMGDNGIVEALTADRHFEQAGFNCLLVPGIGC